MSIAYSKRSIISTQIRADTSAHFIADLTDAVTQAGWRKIRDITKGAVYQCFTPDGVLSAKLQIQDKGTGGFGGSYVTFTAMTANEHAHGGDHTIVFGNPLAPVYQVVIGVCQLFLSIPSYSVSPFFADNSSCFAFGIPFVKDVLTGSSCAAGGSARIITDIWWANGDGNIPFTTGESWRLSPKCLTSFDYSLNGAVSSFTQAPNSGMLTLFFLSPTYNIDAGGAQISPTIKHGTHAPINLDSLIGWQYQVQGQLWDSFQRSRAESLDAVQTYQDTDSQGGLLTLQFQVWMSSTYSSLLLLRTTVSAGGGNVAY